jgi:hypothetical protein
MPYKDREKQRQVTKRLDEARRTKGKALVHAAKSGGCLFCGEKELVCLDLHHLNPSEKDFELSGSGLMRTEADIIAEVAKCVVLCANCHRKLHAGILSL